MPNERKTENIVRQFLRNAGYYDDLTINVEEQQSADPRIKKLLSHSSKRGYGQGYPEFIITSSKYPEMIIVIECKAEIQKHRSETLEHYADYAVDGALLYSSFLSKEFDVLAIGISGEKKSNYRLDHYLALKGENTTHHIFSNTILSFEEYFEGMISSDYKFNQDYSKLVAYTKVLNSILHAQKIKESQRALLISGILIALRSDAFRNSYRMHTTPKALISNLYSSITNELESSDISSERVSALKQAFGFIETNAAFSGIQGKRFLESLITEIDEQINGFMITHKYFDTVSEFYIEFLRYANNDKGLGIVLTPNHITGLFVEFAGIDKNSVVFDNCCGTGGFLISAMKKMVIDARGDKQKIKEIKDSQLIGIEYQDDIYTLLVTNMIIHRDGRTNAFWGDCFETIPTIKNKFRPTVGLLNPPYKTRVSDTDELEFVLNNLEALEPGGICIAIIPISCVIEKATRTLALKQRLMELHTIEAVLSMPEELFYNSNVNTVTCSVVITAHRPHPRGKKTWLAYCRDDGFVKVKNKGRIDANHIWAEKKKFWLSSYQNREVISEFSVMKELSAEQEWCVEAYLETDYSTIPFSEYLNTVKKFIMFNFLNSSFSSEE